MQIVKASGEREEFDPAKVIASLVSAGVSRARAEDIASRVARGLPAGSSTKEIYKRAYRLVRREGPGTAARYNLKKGIADLGPAGFLFEQYVASLLREMGYETETNVTMRGECISHEIDIVAQKGSEHFLLEAKYRNARGMKIDSEIVMYAQARFLDLAPALEKREGGVHAHRMWVITNTKFTSNAVAYAECKGMKLVGWRHPNKEGLEVLVERTGLYPITALPMVSGNVRLKEKLARAKLATIKDLSALSASTLAGAAGVRAGEATKILAEARLLFEEMKKG